MASLVRVPSTASLTMRVTAFSTLAWASAVRVGRRAESIRKITARASPTPITRASSRPLPRSGLGPRRRGVRSQGRILGLPRMASPPGSAYAENGLPYSPRRSSSTASMTPALPLS